MTIHARHGWLALAVWLALPPHASAQTPGAGAQTPGAEAKPPAAETPAAAQDDAINDTARALYDEAREAWRNRDFDTCRAKATAALELHAHPKIAAVLGDCALDLGRAREAAERLSEAFQGLKNDPHQALLAHLRQRLREAEKQVAKITVTLDPEGAAVTVDGNPVALDQPIYLEPGRHTLRAEMKGREPAEHVLDAKAGELRAVQLSLHPLQEGESQDGGADEPVSTGRSYAPEIALGVTGLLAAGLGGGLLGAAFLANADGNDLRDALRADSGRDNPCAAPVFDAARCSELKAVRNRRNNLRTSGIVVGSIGIAAGLAAVIHYAVVGDGEPAVAGWVGPGGAGASWTLRF